MILARPGVRGGRFACAQPASGIHIWHPHIRTVRVRRNHCPYYVSRHITIQDDKYVISDALRKGIVEYGSSYEDDSEDDVAVGTRSATSPSVSTATYECVRIIPKGRATKLYLKRRDLLRSFALAPRDLRRIDPNLSFTRSSPVLTIKDNVLLVQLSGVRLIITAQSALLLDPRCRAARQYLEQIVPRLQVSAGQRFMEEFHLAGSSTSSIDENGSGNLQELPFELEILEAALNLAVGKLDNELVRAQERVQLCLQKLPRDISPANLDDLRRIKGTLVELESASDAYREMLEDIMDDEEELREVNLSSRVQREVRQRARERERLEREMAREREEQVWNARNVARSRFVPLPMRDHGMASHITPRLYKSSQDLRRIDGGTSPPAGFSGRTGSSDTRDPTGFGVPDMGANSTQIDTLADRSPRGNRSKGRLPGKRPPPNSARNSSARSTALNRSMQNPSEALQDISRAQRDVLQTYSGSERYSALKEPGAAHGFAARPPGIHLNGPSTSTGSTDEDDNPSGTLDCYRPLNKARKLPDDSIFYNFDGDMYSTTTPAEAASKDPMGAYVEAQDSHERNPGILMTSDQDRDSAEYRNRITAPSMDYWHDTGTLDLSMDNDGYLAQMVESEAQMELREMEEAEEEEQELQEVEDLLEFYLQRATSIQTEAERLLAGARDLEESIGLALSARRFEVNRLELQLSIGGFAAALGAMFAGIFGMNLRSTLEDSILGFWGTTFAIIAGCVWVYVAIMRWTKTRKIFN